MTDIRVRLAEREWLQSSGSFFDYIELIRTLTRFGATFNVELTSKQIVAFAKELEKILQTGLPLGVTADWDPANYADGPPIPLVWLQIFWFYDEESALRSQGTTIHLPHLPDILGGPHIRDLFDLTVEFNNYSYRLEECDKVFLNKEIMTPYYRQYFDYYWETEITLNNTVRQLLESLGFREH